MIRDIAICLLSSLNILMFTFIGLNSAAISKVVAYEVPSYEQELAFDALTAQLQEKLLQDYLQTAKLQSELAASEDQKTNPASKPYVAIPKLELLAPIGYQSGADQDDVRQILAEGALSLEPFVPPGESGRTIIFGHSSDYSWNNNPYGTLFTLLPQLDTGDVIKIVQKRQVYRYRVDQTLITDAELSGLPQEYDNQIVLSTCYPIGFFEKRFNVIASPI